VTLSRSEDLSPLDQAAPAWTDELGGESFLALSESFVNDVVRSELAGRQEKARHPKGDLSKLLRSTAVFALAPGLRGMERDASIGVSFRMTSPPVVRFDTLDGAAVGDGRGPAPAVIRVIQDGLE